MASLYNGNNYHEMACYHHHQKGHSHHHYGKGYMTHGLNNHYPNFQYHPQQQPLLHYSGRGYRAPVYCANCGGFGHIYKNCNHPVTSYGIICFRLKLDERSQCIYPEYLMVQRKDSLSYVEFIRGKYDLEKRNYLLKLFSNMTEHERMVIATGRFEDMWKDLWQVNDCHNFQREYQEARAKYEALKRGYHLRTDDEHIIFFDLAYILANSVSTLCESEWGFPKGRRNINEKDFSCALREFKEETGLNPRFIRVLREHKPFEEIFSGTNKVRYKHIYYMAVCTAPNDYNLVDPHNKQQAREIKDVQWFRYNDAQDRIREQNTERKELFRRVNQVILKNLSIHCKK